MTLIAAAAMMAATQDLPPMDFFCAAPLSHNSQLRIHRGGNVFRVSGRIGPVQLEDVPDASKPLVFDGNNIPSIARSASVEIVDDESQATLALHLTPRNRQPGTETIVSDVHVTTWIDGEQRDYDLTTQTYRDYRDDVDFEIVGRGNEVSVQAGGKRLELMVPFGAKTVVEFLCVGGQFDIKEVEISGRTQYP